jgi:hypothetical protein
MPLPALTTRVEQSDDFLCKRVLAAEIGPFFQIAAMAAPAAIVEIVASTMVPRDNVLHVKCSGAGHIRKPAVFASAARPLANKLAQRAPQGDAAARFNDPRALACRIAMKSRA